LNCHFFIISFYNIFFNDNSVCYIASNSFKSLTAPVKYLNNYMLYFLNCKSNITFNLLSCIVIWTLLGAKIQDLEGFFINSYLRFRKIRTYYLNSIASEFYLIRTFLEQTTRSNVFYENVINILIKISGVYILYITCFKQLSCSVLSKLTTLINWLFFDVVKHYGMHSCFLSKKNTDFFNQLL
jgi:hypothetical protein